jgi:Domain of unknown function (DUF4268)
MQMSAIIALGTFAPVPLTKAWPTEDGNFTPWLAGDETISLLGQALGMELEVEAVEHWVGAFRADILARVTDETDHRVIIENQFGRTDHKHLGQILTYLAGIEGAKTVVWIAETVQSDHRAAVDWLNENTLEAFAFFAIEIELWCIGQSPPSPRFNVVASPNDWTKETRSAARRASEVPTNPTQLLQQKYWMGLKESFAAAGETDRFPKPWPRHWLPFKIGRGGFELDVVLLRAEKRIRFELYMGQKGVPPKQAFNLLCAQRDDVERDYGGSFDWQELPDKMASRIAVYLDNADPDNQSDWPRQHRWILEQLHAFRRVFRNRIRALVLEAEETSEEPGIEPPV